GRWAARAARARQGPRGARSRGSGRTRMSRPTSSPARESARTRASSRQRCNARSRGVASAAKQSVEVLLLPGAGPRVIREAALLGQELGAVEAAPPVLTLDLVFAVQHLVKDDPRHEVVGHAVLVQGRVDADDAIFDREAPHLDRPAPLATRRDR